jgi:hypothetical protein
MRAQLDEILATRFDNVEDFSRNMVFMGFDVITQRSLRALFLKAMTIVRSTVLLTVVHAGVCMCVIVYHAFTWLWWWL